MHSSRNTFFNGQLYNAVLHELLFQKLQMHHLINKVYCIPTVKNEVLSNNVMKWDFAQSCSFWLLGYVHLVFSVFINEIKLNPFVSGACSD